MDAKYVIYVNGTIIETFDNQPDAFKAAGNYGEDDLVRVALVVTSGTERSTTQVWPTRSETFAQHR